MLKYLKSFVVDNNCCIFVHMKTLNLNLNASNPLYDLDSAKIVNEEEFWRNYLYLLNLNKPLLTDLELKVFAYILAQDYDKSVFRWNNPKKAANDLGIDRPQLSRVKNKLIEKQFLQVHASKLDVLPHKLFRSFQKYVKNNKGNTINFMFPYSVKLN